MKLESLVKDLRDECTDCSERNRCNQGENPVRFCPIIQAADAIERLEKELKQYQDAAAEYGIDAHTMLALAKSQIATAKENAELREELAKANKRTEYVATIQPGNW